MPETLVWKDPVCPIEVEYSPAVLENIRRLAVDALLSLPRVGLGIGGFLLGTRDEGKAVILDSYPIACSHATGPSFAPTATEIEEAKASVREQGGESLEVLGFYCSRPRLAIQMGEKERALFRNLCPGAGQMGLLIRPSSTNDSLAGLFYRKSGGIVAGGTELPLESPGTPDGAPEEIAESEQSPPPQEIPAPSQGIAPEVIPQAIVVQEPLASSPEPAVIELLAPSEESAQHEESAPHELIAPPDPFAPPEEIPQPELIATQPPPRPPSSANRRPIARGPLPVLNFPPVAPRRKSRWLLVLTVVLLLMILIAVAAFATRDQWWPRPPLELRTADTSSGFFIEWNRSAVRGLDHAVLTVIDGTSTKTILIDGRQLQAGTIPYARQTMKFTAALDAGSVHATATFVPPPPAPEPPPAPARSGKSTRPVSPSHP